MVTRLLGQGSSLGVLLLSWGLFLDPKRTLLQWKILIHHVIFGLSTFIPVAFFGFFFFGLSTYIPMGFHGFFFFFFLYPSTYSSASLVLSHSGLESGEGILGACGSCLVFFQFCLSFL